MKLKKLSALGIGFAGLDIIKYNKQELILPGGTCANVLSVLSSVLNWSSDIVKCKYNDVWDRYIDALWSSIGVNVLECHDVDFGIPRVVQTIRGTEQHSYTTCPYCHTKLVKIVLPTERKIKISIEKKEYDLLFFDRISPGTKYLLDLFNQQDKWTFYEPNGMRIYKTWVKNISTCDIVKFSDSRIPKLYYEKLIQDLNNMQHKTKIIIITHAEKGFSYSLVSKGELSMFKTIPVSPFQQVLDPSGAGDWASAGFIHKFLQSYHTPTEEIDEKSIVDSLIFGHSLAEIGCNSIGALGKIFKDKESNKPHVSGVCEFCKSNMI